MERERREWKYRIEFIAGKATCQARKKIDPEGGKITTQQNDTVNVLKWWHEKAKRERESLK